MRITISFKHIEHTEALDELIQKKTHKLEKYLDGQINVHWFCSAHNGQHEAEIKITGNNCHFEAHATSDNLYKTMDMAIDKVERQLEKKKDKWKNHKGDTSLHKLKLMDPEVAWTDYDEETFDDVESIIGEMPLPLQAKKVTPLRKKVAAKAPVKKSVAKKPAPAVKKKVAVRKRG